MGDSVNVECSFSRNNDNIINNNNYNTSVSDKLKCCIFKARKWDLNINTVYCIFYSVQKRKQMSNGAFIV